MFEKYRVYHADIVIAIKFNHLHDTVTTGGLVRFRPFIESIISDYMQCSLTEPIFVQKNKIRYEFRCSLKQFRSGISLLKEHGITLESVQSLGRLMR